MPNCRSPTINLRSNGTANGALHAFFTATSMIGFMAGAGIVVRNSIILVDFIEQRLAEGMPLGEAVVDAGAVRFRPMLLTALAVVVGATVILFDPIFHGLAISLMAGEVASLLISRMAVPVIYFMSHNKSLPGETTGKSETFVGTEPVQQPAGPIGQPMMVDLTRLVALEDHRPDGHE